MMNEAVIVNVMVKLELAIMNLMSNFMIQCRGEFYFINFLSNENIADIWHVNNIYINQS